MGHYYELHSVVISATRLAFGVAIYKAIFFSGLQTLVDEVLEESLPLKVDKERSHEDA